MTRSQWLASAALTFHVLALFSASVPHPSLLNSIETTTSPGSTRLSETFAPTFDGLAHAIAETTPVLYRMLTPIRTLTTPYIAAGLGNQQWNMFSNPLPFDQYMRLDSWVGSADPTTWRLFRHVILPADDERRVRGLHQYRDKAIINALENANIELARQNGEGSNPSSPASSEALRHLEPVTRWGRARVAAHVSGGERVQRIEIWWGRADNPAPGVAPDAGAAEARLMPLEPYREGPRGVPGAQFRSAAVWDQERRADLTWTLLVVSTP